MLDIKNKYSLESARVQMDPGHGARLLIVIETKASAVVYQGDATAEQ